MTGRSQHPSNNGGVSIALFATLFLHLAVLVSAMFIRLHEPPQSDVTVQLTFRRSPHANPVVQPAKEVPKDDNARASQARPRPPLPTLQPPQRPPRPRQIPPQPIEKIQADIVRRDSAQKAREMTLRSVLDKKLSPEQAWEILAKLLTEHPEFRDTVLREMIAGQGYVPDSLPPVNLYFDQIFKNGIRPTWEAQRGAVEHANRSFDPVQGWMNKGGYGPQINVIGLLQFLLGLIEGK